MRIQFLEILEFEGGVWVCGYEFHKHAILKNLNDVIASSIAYTSSDHFNTPLFKKLFSQVPLSCFF